MRHIVLIGLSGSGKSTLGGLLAEELGMPFVDLDLVVERELGMSVREIFDAHGEGFFRDAEARASRDAAANPTPSVIATGGGVVLRHENVISLRKNGFIVFLDRPVDMIARDIPYDNSRPLAGSAEKLYGLERERRALYLDSSDAVLRNDSGASEALERLISLVGRTRGEFPGGYAVIGDPIAHTLSPTIHGVVFETLDVAAPYNALHLTRAKLGRFVQLARESGIRGFNVTIPHKRDIIPLLDGTDGEARLCGAVNTVLVRDGRLSGFNTDMGGLLASLREAGFGYRGGNIVILGAGGASRGAAFKASIEGAASVKILARSLERAMEIAASAPDFLPCPISPGRMSGDEMSDAASRADILINATPLGMSGIREDFESLDFLRALPRGALVCDLVYKPAETGLLRRARELGYATQNGLGMLIWQALLADEIFLDRELDKTALYKIVRGRLVK